MVIDLQGEVPGGFVQGTSGFGVSPIQITSEAHGLADGDLVSRLPGDIALASDGIWVLCPLEPGKRPK